MDVGAIAGGVVAGVALLILLLVVIVVVMVCIKQHMRRGSNCKNLSLKLALVLDSQSACKQYK